MQEIFEEYGEFIIEIIGGSMFLILMLNLFFGSPIKGLIIDFIAGVVG